MVAIVQNDIKKILAYSTLSQLGYMVMALGLANPQAGMFHLTTHAFFKALLFLGAGCFIHALHTQDIWKMSGKGALQSMPVTSWTFLIGTLALMGIPPLSGYFSKESILRAAQHGPALLFVMAMAVVFLTAFYMGRLCTLVFFRAPSTSSKSEALHDSGWQISLPLILLGIFAVVGGFLPIQELVGTPHVHGGVMHASPLLAILSTSLAVLGFGISFWIYRKKSEETVFAFPKSILAKKFYFDDLYDALIQRVQENLATLSDLFERVVVVESAVNGTARLTRYLGNVLRKFQTGVVQFHALVFTSGVTALIYLLVLKGM